MKQKLIFLLAMILALLALASCREPEYVINVDLEDIHTEQEGIYLTLDSVMQTAISVVWHNDTDKEAIYGEDYYIEKLEDGVWVSVLTEDFTVEAIGIILMPHSETKKTYSTAPFDLSALGRYRLRCKFFPSEGTCNTWVEFEVAEKTDGDVNRIPNADVTLFAEFLDREGFVPGMSQGDLLDLAEKYAEGLDPSLVPVFCHYDGEFGGGCMASGKYFGYTNDYHAERGKVRYVNSLYTTTDLKNLALPCGITFDDSLGDVLEKMGIDRGIYKNAVVSYSSDQYLTELPLYSRDGVSLVLTNWALSQIPEESLCRFTLAYTETADTDRKDGSVTRTVTLSFLGDEIKLGKFEIKVVENYRR